MVALMAETRTCDQCGTVFVPRREHARFCSARCRVAWNQENSADAAAETGALAWSIGAMGEVTERLAKVGAWDPARGFGAVSGGGGVDFVHAPPAAESGPESGATGITGWIWNSLPRPALAGVLPRGRAWEM